MFKILSAKADTLKTHLIDLRQERFFRDKLSMGLLAASIALNAANLVAMLIRLRPTEFPVPIHYSSLNGFNTLGPWYHLYQVVIFAAAVTAMNAYLAYLSFSRSRITSFFLLTGAIVVALFSLIISLALSSVVAG